VNKIPPDAHDAHADGTAEARDRDIKVAQSSPMERIDETTAHFNTEPEVTMDSAMDTESIPSFSPTTDVEDGSSEVPVSMPPTPTSSRRARSGTRSRKRGKQPKKDDGEYAYEKEWWFGCLNPTARDLALRLRRKECPGVHVQAVLDSRQNEVFVAPVDVAPDHCELLDRLSRSM